jgi:hypothetical protein
MTPAAIIKNAAAEGVMLALTPVGTIKATGEGAAVNRWLPVIREHKPGIVTALQEAANEPLPDPATEARRRRLLELLAENPSRQYALVTDTGADPVILAMGIRGVMQDGSTVTFELLIPEAKYDGYLLLDLLNRYGGTIH